MKKIIRNAGILFLIFIVAMAVYFVSARKNMPKEDAIYLSMEEADFPVLYAGYQGKKINALHGYVQDMAYQASEDSILILPEDRKLVLYMEEYGNTITDINYEIRNLTMDRLIERTELTDWESDGTVTTMTLPVQNLLTRDETYLLTVTIGTGEQTIHYYSRVMLPQKDHAGDMLALAEEFTRKSLNYDEARDLVSYLETSGSEDNSSLGHTTIRSSFQHLTWDGLSVEMEGEPLITLQEYDGIMGQIKVAYQVRLTKTDGTQFTAWAEDNFTMKWDEQRIYLMNYDRYVNEIFTGARSAFNGKRIVLGISDGNNISSVKSENGRYLTFRVNGNLWSYDQKAKEALCIFTFSGNQGDDIRSGYQKHDVRILSAGDDGNVDFLVYGYMNRGQYEGQTGVVFYHYDREKNVVQEKFFIPVMERFEKLDMDIGRLSYLSPNGMMYLMLDGNVFGIDLNSNESIVVAQGLTEGNFAVSADGSRVAWQEESAPYPSNQIHVMDFNTASKEEIQGESGDYARVLGFVGNDLIYGFGKKEDVWMVNERVKDLPMYAIYIVDSQMNVESQYIKDGMYMSDVESQDGRIHLKCYVKAGENQYVYHNEDTIVCNEKVETDPLAGIGWYSDSEKKKTYFVQADSEIKSSSVKTGAPKAFSYENTSMLTLAGTAGAKAESQMVFYAYGGGHYLGASASFKTAVDLAYEKMGVVTDQNHALLWSRVDRQPVKNIKDPVKAAEKVINNLSSFTESTRYTDGMTVIDASGCSLNQVLYFIDKGIPVVAYTEGDQYLLLSGYDTYNVTLYDPVSGESWKMGLGDATDYFNGLHNDFLCAVSGE